MNLNKELIIKFQSIKIKQFMIKYNLCQIFFHFAQLINKRKFIYAYIV